MADPKPDSYTTANVLARLPGCALDCGKFAFSAAYCRLTTKLCDCRPGDADKIRAAVSPCLKQKCSTDDSDNSLEIFPSICYNGSGDGEAPSSTSTGSSRSTTTDTSTPHSSSTDGAKATSSMSKAGAATAAATGVSNTPVKSASDDTSPGGGLSAGEKATIGVGALLGVIFTLIILAWVFRRRIKRMRGKKDRQESETRNGSMEGKATEAAPGSRQGVAELEGNPVSEAGGHPIAELP